MRFTNVAPPNPPDKTTGKVDPNLFVYDTRLYNAAALADASAHPVPFYTSDGTTGATGESVQFQVSDVSAAATQAGINYLAPQILTTAPYTDGYVVDAAATPPSFFADVTTNLVANNGSRYLGVYTYSIGDGSALDDTPGARRKFQEVKQYVTEYDYMGGDRTQLSSYKPIPGRQLIGGDSTSENIVPQLDPNTGQYTFTQTSKIAAVDQPTFGVLNPLGVRGGGVPLLTPNPPAAPTAVPVGDELGPFRAVQSPPTLGVTPAAGQTPDPYALQALANGNDIPTVAPPSSSGSTGNPTIRPEGANDPNGITTPTTTSVVVTTTGEINHNATGDNSETAAGTPTGTAPGGVDTTNDGLVGGSTAPFGGYALDVFDRSALYQLGQTLRLKMTVPTNIQFAPAASKDGMYWNSNFDNPAAYPDNTGHDSVVNFLPWETPPVPYSVGTGNMTNGSQDYPDLAPGNITQTATSSANSASPGDLTSNSVTLPRAVNAVAAAGQTAPTNTRTVYGDPVRIQVAVPHYQPANQQLYQQPAGRPAYTVPATAYSQQYRSGGEIPPVNEAGTSQILANSDSVFPMGYVTTKRLFVPDGRGFYNPRRAYRDVRIYTGVKVDMQTSIVNPTTDIGKVPAAFGVQTENDPTYGLFSPYGSLASGTYQASPFGSYFKPLEVHNDGNVNLLNVHFDQRVNNAGTTTTLQLLSDAVDPLSFLQGYDVSGVTGPRPNNSLTPVPEQPFLIRTSVDTDLYAAYGRNPLIAGNYSAIYPGATFHKPTPGGSQPSTLTVPDAPERFVADASPETGTSFQVSPTGTPILPTRGNGVGGVTYQAEPFVSLATPFGTPVGTYATPSADQINSLRLFEGLDTAATNGYNPNTVVGQFYPPVYGGAIGGYYGQNYSGTAPSVNPNNGEIQGTNGDEGVYNGTQPLSTLGTQLIGTVVEQRLTDGATYGAVPMIDAGPAGPAIQANGVSTPESTPDFAPAAFRDPNTGDLSVYWTSGRTGSFGIAGANLPFNPPSAASSAGYFLPNTPPTAAKPTGEWWTQFTPGVAPGVNSGLSVTPGPTGANGTSYAFDTAVLSTAPYSSTLYSYTVNPATGALGSPPQAITPTSDTAQVKYGVKGLYTSFTDPLWAFWTGTTRGRTALYYNSQGGSGTNGGWLVPALLPVPAGLTAVADASPLLTTAPVNGQAAAVIEVTYSGTGPDGNIDLYVSRYRPHVATSAQDTIPASQLDLVAFPPVTENLRAVSGWYQARDAAWSRTGALNVSVSYQVTTGGQTTLVSKSLLYNGNTPLFKNAIYDKASGFLVLTGVQVPIINPSANGPTATTHTVTVDAATGRVRFSPALSPATQNFTQIQATFSPQARRLTIDSRADTAPVTFMDEFYKPNDAPGQPNVIANRRWTVWRKAGTAGVPSSATLYFKTQRLTAYLPSTIGITTHPATVTTPVTYTTNLTSVTVNGTDITSQVDVDYARQRLYFPLTYSRAGAVEGQVAVVSYTDAAGNAHTFTTDTIQWQDEPLANNNDVPPADTAAGLDTVLDYTVPIDTAINENNVAAFLDPFAGANTSASATTPHKVWLFWNSTRNGTADIYSETIDPRFAPLVTTP